MAGKEMIGVDITLNTDKENGNLFGVKVTVMMPGGDHTAAYRGVDNTFFPGIIVIAKKRSACHRISPGGYLFVCVRTDHPHATELAGGLPGNWKHPQ